MRTHHLTTYAVATALALVVGGTAFWYISRPPAGDDPVFSRKVLDYREVPAKDGGLAVEYSYVGERLPDRLERNEIPELRTESSYVIEVAEPTKDKRTFEGRFFPQEAFVQENGAWFYKESATTTTTAFNALQKRNPVVAFFIPKARALSYTPFSSSGDGEVIHGNSTSWATVHDATTGTSAGSATSNATAGVALDTSGIYSIYRAFLPFNTATIPASATISSASLNIRAIQAVATDNDAQAYLTVVQTSQPSHVTLSTADYDLCGSPTSPTEGVSSGDRKNLATLSTSSYTSFTLNSTGRGWIKKNGQSSSCSSTTGITCFGIREGHDTANVATDVQSDTDGTFATFYTSEISGTSNDPYLSVTYSLPPGSYNLSESFVSLGYQEWVAPATVSSADVACWGGGGGGGDGGNIGGGGGGGGAYAASTVVVTPSSAYPVFIGSGGAGASASSNIAGSAGTDSMFATTTVVADGGSAGSGGLGGTGNPPGGAGGSTANSTGTTEFAGGAGGSGDDLADYSGGGGGAAGPQGAGGAGTSANGSANVPGGNGNNGSGGAGGSTNNSGTASALGGGGGGGGSGGGDGGAGGAYGGGGGGGEGGGGAGASGACVISYTLIVPSPFSFWQWMDF